MIRLFVRRTSKESRCAKNKASKEYNNVTTEIIIIMVAGICNNVSKKLKNDIPIIPVVNPSKKSIQSRLFNFNV